MYYRIKSFAFTQFGWQLPAYHACLPPQHHQNSCSFNAPVHGYEKSYQRCAAFAPGKKKFKFKNKLYSLDASTIDLCLSVSPLAKFRSTKGVIKLHALLDHDGYIPALASITDAKTSDLAYARTLTLPLGSIVVADRAYID